jgi:predicted nuclease of predicted toxin-antitoxin system
MRFLVDSCVSSSVCAFLRKAGHDVVWVPDEFSGDPGDEAIIDKANQERSILVTGDKDFGEWIFLRGKPQPPLVRLVAMAPINQVRVLDSILKVHADDLRDGALITASQNRLRVRRKK